MTIQQDNRHDNHRNNDDMIYLLFYFYKYFYFLSANKKIAIMIRKLTNKNKTKYTHTHTKLINTLFYKLIFKYNNKKFNFNTRFVLLF